VVLVAPILTGSALAGLARSAPGAAALVWSVAVGCMVRGGARIRSHACGRVRGLRSHGGCSGAFRSPPPPPPPPAHAQLQLLLASLLVVATHLEDPLASPHPDALSIWEAHDGLSYVSGGARGLGDPSCGTSFQLPAAQRVCGCARVLRAPMINAAAHAAVW